MIWSLLSWLSQHPADLVVWLLFVVAMTFIVSGVVYRLMLASETRKAEQQRKRLDQLRRLSPDVKPMADAYSGRAPRAPGLHPRKVS